MIIADLHNHLREKNLEKVVDTIQENFKGTQGTIVIGQLNYQHEDGSLNEYWTDLAQSIPPFPKEAYNNMIITEKNNRHVIFVAGVEIQVRDRYGTKKEMIALGPKKIEKPDKNFLDIARRVQYNEGIMIIPHPKGPRGLGDEFEINSYEMNTCFNAVEIQNRAMDVFNFLPGINPNALAEKWYEQSQIRAKRINVTDGTSVNELGKNYSVFGGELDISSPKTVLKDLTKEIEFHRGMQDAYTKIPSKEAIAHLCNVTRDTMLNTTKAFAATF